ncbi:MAG: MFS transporter [Gemmatimonadales bacterium]|nr:MFS transporter [Gemmatimonadales bacterium]
MTAATGPWDLYPPRRRWTFLAVLFLVSTSNYVDRNIIGVLLKPIKREFGVSDTMLGLLTGFSFAIFYATLGIPVARWADRGDRKIILTVSLAAWSVMTAFCGMAQSFVQLALARIGVGAGEAGALPPAQSLIADYYPPAERGKALGTFMMSSMAGYVLGVVVGGQIAQAYGWRAAFLTVGLPGLLLAVVTYLVLDEPRRQPRFAVAQASMEPLRTSIKALMAKRSFVDITIAMVLYFLMAYGAFVFTVSYLIRTHGLSVGRASAIFGTVSTVTAVIGSLVGGALADRLARRHISWLARLPGWVLILALPAYELAFSVRSLAMTVVFLGIGGSLLTGAIPSMFAALHAVCGSARRAMSVAVIFFFANLIGTGLGPIITGRLSDYFAASVGPAEGLRYAMMIVMVTFVPSGWFMLRASRNLARDQEA